MARELSPLFGLGIGGAPLPWPNTMAEVLLVLYGIALEIIDTQCGARAFDKAFGTMAKCDAFMVSVNDYQLQGKPTFLSIWRTLSTTTSMTGHSIFQVLAYI